jgi:hypothetical protein
MKNGHARAWIDVGIARISRIRFFLSLVKKRGRNYTRSRYIRNSVRVRACVHVHIFSRRTATRSARKHPAAPGAATIPDADVTNVAFQSRAARNARDSRARAGRTRAFAASSAACNCAGQLRVIGRRASARSSAPRWNFERRAGSNGMERAHYRAIAERSRDYLSIPPSSN